MEIDAERSLEIRAVIKFLTPEGNNVRNIHQRLFNVYGDRSPGYSTVARWVADFKHGRNSLNDEPRSERPADMTTIENMNAIREMVEDNHNESTRNGSTFWTLQIDSFEHPTQQA